MRLILGDVVHDVGVRLMSPVYDMEHLEDARLRSELRALNVIKDREDIWLNMVRSQLLIINGERMSSIRVVLQAEDFVEKNY